MPIAVWRGPWRVGACSSQLHAPQTPAGPTAGPGAASHTFSPNWVKTQNALRDLGGVDKRLSTLYLRTFSFIYVRFFRIAQC